MVKTWFITGVSSGLGLKMTENLLLRGDRVAGTARRLDALDPLKERYGDQLWIARLDVTDAAAVRRVVDQAFGAMGRIEVVVSNAGYGLFGAAEELNDEQMERQVDTNLVGSIRVIRAALPHLRIQGGGRILQVSSEGGQIAYPGFSLYHATKWGIEGFVEAVSQEVTPFNIEFTIIEPGPTATDFGKGLVSASPIEAYQSTPVGDIRRAWSSGGFSVRGDAEKTARAMIDCADRSPAPRRLTLGSDAYERVHTALATRIAVLQSQQGIARSTDLERFIRVPPDSIC